MRKLILLLAASVLGLTFSLTATHRSAAVSTATLSAVALPTPPATNPDLDFTIVNKTGYAIKALYIGLSSEKNWTDEDEVLKGRKFPNGASYDITFSPRQKAKKWDIMVEWSDGSEADEWLNLDLTKIETVTLKYDRPKNQTWVECDPKDACPKKSDQ